MMNRTDAMTRLKLCGALVGAAALLGLAEGGRPAHGALTQPLGTGFMYQGELASGGAPASGQFDVRFTLFDAPSGGTQIGEVQCLENQTISGGRFAVTLDFGAVFAGQRRYLEIAVRPYSGLGCASGGGLTVLSPRQEIAGVPLATFASSAATLTGTLPAVALAGTYGSAVTLSSAGNLFAGNGASLTNLSAGSISTGVLDAARMPTTWAAGGDLSGVYPNPVVASVGWSKITGAPIATLAATAPTLAGWGANDTGQINVPALPPVPAGLAWVSASAGGFHSVGLRSDGSAVAWGNSFDGRTTVPELPLGVSYTGVYAGYQHSVALRSDGVVVAWGNNVSGQTAVPAAGPGMSYTAAAAGGAHSAALRSDGTIVAWGLNTSGQSTVPTLPGGTRYVAVTAGRNHTVALRSDGAVVAWGLNTSGQTTVPALGTGQSYVAVAAGGFHTLAMRSDGVLVAWGLNDSGQCNVPAPLTGAGFVAVSAGGAHSGALRSDGTVALWGSNASGQSTPAAAALGERYTLVALGGDHTLALRSRPAGISVDGPIIASSLSGNGSGLSGVAAVTAASATTAANATLLNGQPASFYLSAGNLTGGTLGDGLLSANVALRGVANNFANFTNTFLGSIGIGTTSPAAKLHVSTPAVGAGWQVRLTNTGPGASGFETGMRASDTGFFEMTNRTTGFTGLARLGPTGAWTISSDARLKTDIRPATGNLEAALRLRPVRFSWLAEGPAGKTELGLIAQEVRTVLPEFVTGDEACESLTVNYAQLSVVAIGAIAEQQAQITRLTAENAELRKRMEAVEAAVKAGRGR